MQKLGRLLAVFFLVLCPLVAWSLPKVAVLDLTLQKGIDATVIAPVTESVMEEVVDARAYVVLDRAYIEQILKEKEFQLSGMVSDTQVAQAGQYLGADYVVAGKIQMVGDTYFVVAKMIEVKTGVIVAQSSVQGEGKLAVLLTMAHAVGKKLVAGAPISALAPANAAAPQAAALAATAPASKAPPADQRQTGDPLPAMPVKLAVFTLRDPSGPDAPIWKALLDAFRKKYPTISVAEDSMKDAGPYYQRLAANATSSKMPDVFVLGRDKSLISQYPAMNLWQYLGGREAELLAPTLRPEASGYLRFLPMSVTASSMLYANAGLLEKLGLSFPDSLEGLMAQAPAIAAAGLIPIAMAVKDGWQMQSCLLSTLADRLGGAGWLAKAASGRGASFKDPSFVAAVDALKRMSDAKLFAPDILSQDYGVPLSQFIQGRAVYMLDGGWRASALVEALDEGRKAGLAIRALPALAGEVGAEGSTTATVEGFAMNDALSGDKEAAAWLFLWFMAGPEGQKIRFERNFSATGSMDPRKFEDAVDPVWQRLFDALGKAYEAEIIDYRLDCSTLNTSIQGLLAGKKTSAAVAADFESWVARNEPTRKK